MLRISLTSPMRIWLCSSQLVIRRAKIRIVTSHRRLLQVIPLTFQVLFMFAFVVDESDALGGLEVLVVLVIFHFDKVRILNIAFFAEVQSILAIEVAALALAADEFEVRHFAAKDRSLIEVFRALSPLNLATYENTWHRQNLFNSFSRYNRLCL